MTAPRLLLGALLVAALALTWPGRLAAQAAQKAMYVSVVNDAGAPVMDLGTADFIIREDNVAREVLRVEPASDPMQIAVLVDNSSAARDNISHMRQALPPFVAALTEGPAGQQNEVSIIAIGERPTVLADYSTSRTALQKGIDRIWALHDTGAYLLDGIPEVCQGFKKREAARPVIVAIAAEGAELSSRHPDQVLTPLRESGATLHVISLGTPPSGVGDDVQYLNRVVDEGSRTTGGTHTQLLTSTALANRLQQLANVLTHSYRVVYAHPDSLIPPQRVTVAARRSDVTAFGTPVKEPQVPR
jgi:hypothetical protein